jgi:hypothetical protein
VLIRNNKRLPGRVSHDDAPIASRSGLAYYAIADWQETETSLVRVLDYDVDRANHKGKGND